MTDTLPFISPDERDENHADWRDAYTAHTTFNLGDAARILAGIPPGYDSLRGSDDRPGLKAKLWAETLESNIDELVAPTGRNEATPSMHILSHNKIRVWCAREGINWPIPENYVNRIKALEQELEQERSLRLKAQHIADPVMSVLVKNDASPSPAPQDFEPLVLSRIESVGLNAIAKVVGGDSKELRRRYEKDVKRGAELFGLLGLQVSHQSHRRSPLQQSALIPTPLTLQINDPEEVYRHLDYLTADQALDWMSRISGHHVEWDTLWGMVGFNMCRAFMDCRAVQGLTYAAEGEHEHRKVFGLGICQIMNAVRAEGAPLHLQGPAIHVDMYGLQEIVPNRSWWINHFEDYDVLFRPSDIEKLGQIVNERGGWSGTTPIMEDESNQFGEQLPEYSGSELAQLLGNLQITIDNLHDRIRYCVRFEDGRLLAELGADLIPLAAGSYIENQTQELALKHTACANDAHEHAITQLERVIAEQKEQIETLQQFNAPELPQLSAGITFPYSTEGLEALRSVALKHWAGYTPDKRQPTQKEIGYAICEELEIAYQKTNEPPRKAKVLATLIKPDELPDA